MAWPRQGPASKPCTGCANSVLFGHVKGAFTGAVRDTEGKAAAAEGGTLFLDEIGDLPLSVQPKLLRLLQDRCYERVGDTKTKTVNIRIIAATNRDLTAETAAGRFREDLYYRLNVIDIEMPPLRQRPGDILPLAKHLLGFFARQTGKAVRSFSPEAETALARHTWPGNIRELRNAIERGVILANGTTLERGHLPGQVGNPPPRVEVNLRWGWQRKFDECRIRLDVSEKARFPRSDLQCERMENRATVSSYKQPS